MALISLKCTNCGGELQADNTWNSVVCPYCRATFAVMPDVNNYNTTNNINANVVNITYNITQQAPPVQETPKPKQSNPDFIIEDNVLKAYTGHSSIVNIPYGVIEIAAGCFMGRCGISKVIIPDTVIKIGTQAFKNCMDLKEIVASPRLKKLYSSMFESGIGATNKAVDLNKSYSQQSSYSNKSNSLTYRTQSDTYNPAYKPSPSKSVAKEYVKDHPEQFKKDTSNRWSFWGFIGSLWLGVFHIWDDNHNKNQNIYNVIWYLIIVTSITLIIFLSPVVTIYAIVADECDNLLVEEGILFPIVSIVEFILLVIYIYKRITKK